MSLLHLLLVPALLISAGVPPVVHAWRQQQTAPASPQQQRPRRVGQQAPATERPATPSSPSVGEEIGEEDVVRVDTQLVSVPAVVTDGTGRILTGLRADNFNLFEDGNAQRIANFSTTEAPFEVALLLDTSGSR